MNFTVNGVRVDAHYTNATAMLATLGDSTVDAVVTDPPYGLTDLPQRKVIETMARWAAGELDYVPAGKGMMGFAWDRFVPPPALWAEVLRVLKPGGHCVAFAGARTVDLMSMSMRFAGFENRDLLAWVYGNGVPKAGDQGAAAARSGLDPAPFVGLSPTLKPALDPMVLARKPMGATLLANLAEHRTGALNIDATRIPVDGERPHLETGNKVRTGVYANGTASGSSRVGGTAQGRWPTNLLYSHHPDCTPTGRTVQLGGDGRIGGPPVVSGPVESVDEWACVGGCPIFQIGMDRAKTLTHVVGVADSGSRVGYFPKVKGPAHRAGGGHPTTKPVDLIDWLITLVCPPGGVLLDPFLGSSSTVEAAVRSQVPSLVIGSEIDVRRRPALVGRLAQIAAGL